MSKILTYLFVMLTISVSAQSRLDYLLNDIPQNEMSFRYNVRFHSSIRPRILTNIIKNDTVIHIEEINVSDKNSISITPIADLALRADKTIQYRAMAGLNMEGNFGRKVYARFTYLHGVEEATDFFRLKSTIDKPIKNNLNQKIDLRGRLSYSPNSFINLQGGYDNQFIGEGSRSLFLADYGKPSGFGMARLNFWRIEYMMLYQFLSENNTQQQRVNKYAATHYVSFNAARWFQIGVFESVVFRPKDTLLNRGFEPEYLNPMILYRPQEYQLGSADNVLIGIDAKIKIRNYTLYAQLMMDEFNLADIRGRTRWWANKYAVQAGIKTVQYKGNSKFFLRGEMNVVRPYTYSHLSDAQSYTNQGLPLAHPYGANFAEILAEVKWNLKKWNAEVFVSYSLKGLNADSLNYGGDITIPYLNRPIDDYGHTIGQGKGNNALRSMVRVSYDIIPSIHLQAFVEGHFRYNTFLLEPKAQVFVGIRSRLWNDYRNY
tara:strand:- start:6263 stop:7726 length:1464 start_codon:yes stop_codon:yes gene_type:complete